jgi:hypothetical protein
MKSDFILFGFLLRISLASLIDGSIEASYPALRTGRDSDFAHQKNCLVVVLLQNCSLKEPLIRGGIQRTRILRGLPAIPPSWWCVKVVDDYEMYSNKMIETRRGLQDVSRVVRWTWRGEVTVSYVFCATSKPWFNAESNAWLVNCVPRF